MTDKELQSFRRRLLTLKRRLTGVFSQLQSEALRPVGGEASGNLSNVPIHPADLANDNYEEEVALDLLKSEQQLLKETNDALARLENGTFGHCEECHREISLERLHAIPYARYCLEHARQLASPF